MWGEQVTIPIKKFLEFNRTQAISCCKNVQCPFFAWAIVSLIKQEFKIDVPYQFDNIIQELGIKIDTVKFDGAVYGSYNPSRKEIKLESPDIEIFLHELSHAVDDKLNVLKAGQRNDQEVTAEFSGAVIGYLMGYRVPLGNVKGYIELQL